MHRITLLALAGTLATFSAADPTKSHIGCFSSSTITSQFQNLGTFTFQSPGYCSEKCAALNSSVAALIQGIDCWCGDDIPPSSDMVDASECNEACSGYTPETCGGQLVFDVYHVDGADYTTASGDNSASPTTSASGQIITVVGSTTVLQPASATATAAEAASSSTSAKTTSSSSAAVAPSSKVTTTPSTTVSPQSTGGAVVIRGMAGGLGLAAVAAVFLGL